MLPNSTEEDESEDGGSDEKGSDSHEGRSLASEGQQDNDDTGSQKPNIPDAVHEDDFNGTLHDAVKGRNVAAVRRLLASGIDPNSSDSDGDYPIHLAAHQGDATILESLLERGADIEAKTNGNITALYLAADKGHEATVRLLLDRGASAAPTPTTTP